MEPENTPSGSAFDATETDNANESGVDAASVDRFFGTLREMREALGDKDLEPDPDRHWGPLRDRVRSLAARVQAELLLPLPSILDFVRRESPDSVVAIHNAALELIADSAGLALAAGQADLGRRLLRDARQQSHGLAVAAEVVAAVDAPDLFVSLVRGRWLLGQGKERAADKVFQAALKRTAPVAGSGAISAGVSGGATSTAASSKVGGMRPILLEALHGPRPIKSMPSLSTYNGIGAMFIGSRDKREDNTYITTHVFTVVFMPIFALGAYRVLRADGGYRVFTRNRLSGLARGYNVFMSLVLMGIALAVVAPTAMSALGVDARRAAHDAIALHEAGDDVGAEASLRSLFVTNDLPTGVLEEVVPLYVSLATKRIPSPPTAASLPWMSTVLRTASSSSPATKQSLTAALRPTVEGWMAVLPSVAAIDDVAKVGVYRAAGTLYGESAWKDLANDVAVKEAMRDAETQPRATLLALAAIPGATSQARQAALWDRVPSAGALASLKPQAEAFYATANGPEGLAAVEKLKPLLATVKAREADEARRKLLAPPTEEPAAEDRAALGAAARRAPDDQAVLAAAIAVALADDDLKAATSLLALADDEVWWADALSTVGADVALNQGDLALADHRFDVALAIRVPRFKAALAELQKVSEAVDDRLLRLANSNALDPAIMKRLRAANDAEQRAIFEELYQQERAKDGPLKRSIEAYAVEGDTVGLSLQAAMIKLRLAGEATDEEAEAAMLEGAEATFLAVGAAAGGTFDYQLGLGEVRYRIHKAEEGKTLIEAAAEGGDANQRLQVANVYRGLGVRERARAWSQKVYDGHASGSAERRQAALQLSVLAVDNEEKVAFLKECNLESAETRAMLADAEGRLFEERGDYVEADKKYGESVRLQASLVSTSTAAANNSALTLARRYALTGNVGHLKRAGGLLASAHRRIPGDSIVLSNLLQVSWEADTAAVLDPLLDLAALQLSRRDLTHVAGTITRGAMGEKVSAAWQKRAFEPQRIRLYNELWVLAPTSIEAPNYLAGAFAIKDALDDLRRLEATVQAAPIDLTVVNEMQAASTAASAIERLEVEEKRLAAVSVKTPADMAVLALLRAENLGQLAALRGEIADVEEALRLLGGATWAPLDTTQAEVELLTTKAVVKAMAEHPEMASLEPAFWRLSYDDVVWGLLAGRFPETVRDAIVAEPAFQEAADVRKKSAATKPSPVSWAFARLLEDDAAAATHKAAFTESWAIHTRLQASLGADPDRVADRFKALKTAGIEVPKAP